MEARANTAKTLGLAACTAVVVGNMVGSGFYLSPSAVAPYGALAIVMWIVMGGGAICLGITFARLARIAPATGGPYAYTRMAYGDFAGFLIAWGYWISIWSTLAAIAVAFVGYLDPFFPSIVRNPAAAAIVALGTVWLLIGVNVYGLRTAGWVQLVTTVLKVMPLVLVGFAGFVVFRPENLAVAAPPDGGGLIRAVTSTATLTLWAFLGLESATVPAASIKDPSRTIPRATIIGTVLTAVLYIVSTIGVMSLLDPAALATSTAPFADAARVLGGEGAARIIALGAAISAFGALNGWVLIVGQVPMAIAQDGLFPRPFARLSSRGTPVIGMIIGATSTGAISESR